MNKGFTLIEILVVVGIMGILAIVGVASYNRMGDRAKAQQTAQLIATNLRAAQKDADAGVGGTICAAAGEAFNGIRVSYTAAIPPESPILTMRRLCGANATITRSVELNPPAGVQITWTDNGGGDLTFPPLSNTVLNIPTNISVQTGSNPPYIITVSSSGGISVQ